MHGAGPELLPLGGSLAVYVAARMAQGCSRRNAHLSSNHGHSLVVTNRDG